MSYLALYRKARPQTFDEVKGQDAIVKTIRNQVSTTRTQHAYLFCGTRGTGKTSVAKILARAVNCEHPVNGNPCNSCESCRSILSGASVNVIEIDAASNNGVDNIREIVDEVRYAPTQGNYRVYIIDEVHMLSAGAFNALLKTLEEPPSYVIFILATTDVGKIPATVLSRCQRYDFHRIDNETIVQRMVEVLSAEGQAADEKALRFIARTADGSMRDALSLLDESMALAGGDHLSYEDALSALGAVDPSTFTELLDASFEGDAGKSVLLFERAVENGREVGHFLQDLIWTLRNLMLLSMGSQEAEEVVDVSDAQRDALAALAAKTTTEVILRDIRILSELQNSFRAGGNRRALMEIALIKMARPQMEADAESLRERILILEKKIEELAQGDMGTERVVYVTEHAPAKEAPKPEVRKAPRAASKDLQEIKRHWDTIVGEMKQPFLRQLLADATPQFDATAEDGTLYVQLQNSLAGDHFSDQSTLTAAQDAMRHVIRQLYQIETDIQFKMPGRQETNLFDIAVDEILNDKTKINFDVETEET